ncbi:MAG: DUF167 family protein [Acidimicrobiales bacterium]
MAEDLFEIEAAPAPHGRAGAGEGRGADGGASEGASAGGGAGEGADGGRRAGGGDGEAAGGGASGAGLVNVLVRVRIEPGAGRAGVAGRRGRALRLRVAAPPGTDRALQAAGEVLARVLGVSDAQVEAAEPEAPAPRAAAGAGAHAGARETRLRVTGVDAGDVGRALDRAVTAGGAAPGPRPSHRGAAPGRHGSR